VAETIPKIKNKVWKKTLKSPVPKWHVNQGDSNDCGPFCVTMLVNGIRDANIVNPVQLAREMEAGSGERRYLLPQRIKGWATFPWGVVNALRRMGLQARWRAGASLERLQQNVDEDRPTVVVIGQPLAYKDGKYVGWSHYKIVYAYDDDEWAFVDPAAKTGVVYSYQDTGSFKKQWTAMGRLIIEAWDERK
jgi:hypothetical protein